MNISKKTILIWLSLVSFTVIFQIFLGGYVRLTQSGLSMYDWNVVTGVIPPITDAEWMETFENYQKTPEYIKINVGMSLEDYKFIYYREYNHRIIGRLTGLLYALPALFLLFSGIFKWRDSKIYIVVGILFAAQGVLGWYMVKSGLVDEPHVSHFRLAAHLLMAFFILGLVLWKIFDTRFGEVVLRVESFGNQAIKRLSILFLLVNLQITYGAFVAGLKAGFVSDTFPLMFGYLIPPNLFQTGVFDIFSGSVAVHFIHRWFAFFVLGYSVFLFFKLKNQDGLKFLWLLPAVIVIQIILGLTVIWFHVPILIALIHQGGAIIIFSVILYFLHKIKSV
ncbi:MAG: heme A synthase [Calditrichaeota bacterium]|nr:heme A synthase [Calditrichota bacterium]